MNWVRTATGVVLLLLLIYACDTEFDDGAIPIIPSGMSYVEYPDWGPDGRIIFSSWPNEFSSFDLWYCYENGVGLTRVPTDTSEFIINEFEPSWSPDGTKVVCRVDSHDPSMEDGLYVCDISDGSLTPLITGDTYINPKWSPDGSNIAYILNNDLFVIDAEGGTPEQLTTEGYVYDVEWSPTGGSVIYRQYVNGEGKLISEDLVTGIRNEVYDLVMSMDEIAISRDGEWVAYEHYYENRPITDIFIANLKTKEIRQVTYEKELDRPGQLGAFEPTWSPDGKWIAFVSNRSSEHLFKIRVF